MAFQDDGRGNQRIEPRFDAPGEPDTDAPTDDDEPRPGRRGKLLGAFVALVAVAGFVGIAWYATNQGQKDSAAVVPMIRADKSPIKILPAKPGGMEVPNQDKLIFMQIAPDEKQTKVERLLPPPEKPMPKPTPPQTGKAAPSVPAPPKSEDIVAAAKTPPASQPKLPKPVAPTAKVESPAKPAPQAKETEIAAARDSKPPPPAAKGEVLIQLGAFKDEAVATKAAVRIAARHKTLLSELTVRAVRADLGARGIFYRLRAGPLADQAAADLCAKLKARNQGCMVVKP